jgi:hypothetical protein
MTASSPREIPFRGVRLRFDSKKSLAEVLAALPGKRFAPRWSRDPKDIEERPALMRTSVRFREAPPTGHFSGEEYLCD